MLPRVSKNGKSMKQKIYQVLVNRHNGISYRYHRFHDGAAGVRRALSWIYLLLLNFAYYFLFCHFLGQKPELEIYESRRLHTKISESEANLKENPCLFADAFVDRLQKYDVISFDVFDTLIFRPFALPADLFFLVGKSFDYMDFKNIRIAAEQKARKKCREESGHSEVGLKDIWEMFEKETGLSAGEGIQAEEKTEQNLCYANPFMLEVWKRLQMMNKKMILISDMYLSGESIIKLLENAGYTGIQKIYVSNEYQKSKADGSLYLEVLKDWYPMDTEAKKIKRGRDLGKKKGKAGADKSGFSIVHVGDNPYSDYKMARNCGIDVLPYPNINKNTLLYRSMDMSAIVGSAYRAVVNSHLYNGLYSYGMEYEYGFIYGGLFVVGYCNFIHEYYEKQELDKLLFLSRDGDILKQAYDILFPNDAAEYVYWSRKAAVKIMADEDRHDYFRRFLYHKVNQKYTISQILHSMELDCLIGQLKDWKTESFVDLGLKEELTDKNVHQLRQFIEEKWEQVKAVYKPQIAAAGKYYGGILNGCRKAAVVDIGWAGSGAVSLSHLTEKVWKLPCQTTGIIAGTNTVHNAEPDAAEIFLQTGKLTAYLYSQSHNRDLLKKHDPNRNYNVYWELLLASPTPQFSGFYEGRKNGASFRYFEKYDITLSFGQEEENKEGIKEIQKGILDFVLKYQRHFKDFPCMYRISGRDAYAPMLAAASHNERYLKIIEKRFCIEKNIV